jgi:hypothetical protein
VGHHLGRSIAQERGEYLMIRMTLTPDVVDNGNDHYASVCRPRQQRRDNDAMTSAGCTEESSRSPKRAVTIGCPLRVQPVIDRLQTPPPDRPVDKVMQLLSYALHLALRPMSCCHNSRISLGWLLKAEQEGSLAWPIGH